MAWNIRVAESTWKNSAIQTLKIDRLTTGSPCRLGTYRILGKNIDPKWPIIEKEEIKSLIEAGEKTTRKTGQPVVLKLMTGGRGRPGTRIILPPKASRTTVNPNLKPLPQKPVLEAVARSTLEQTTSDSKSIDYGRVALSKLGNLCRQLARLTQTVDQLKSEVQTLQSEQANRVDLEGEVKLLRQRGETMRRTWRNNQGYTPVHPALPTIDPNSTIGERA